jgi:hypothetical protein
MISSITARGTGFDLKPRTLLRVCTSASKSIPHSSVAIGCS